MKTFVFFSTLISLFLLPLTSYAYHRVWTDQYGNGTSSVGTSLTSDSSGNVYITGYTHSILDGSTNSGSADVILSKYSSDGIRLWTRQYGSSNAEIGSSIDIDSSGNLYITGWTQGDLDGNINSGDVDIFLTKFTTGGTRLWTIQYGTTHFESGDAVTTDSNSNIYITGRTYGDLDGNINMGTPDIFLTKFSSNGTRLWTKQYGTSNVDTGNAVTTDSSDNIYITGETRGDLDGNTKSGGQDVFLTRFSSDGTKIWTEQYGTIYDQSGKSVTTDSSGNVYITGDTQGDFEGNINSGGTDIFLTKYTSSGAKLWTKMYGSSAFDYGRSITTDYGGNPLITGETRGDLDGTTNSGWDDIFLTKFSGEGIRLWTNQYGSTSYDFGNSVTADGSGNIYITGETQGDLDGNTNSGSIDIFLSKFTQAISPAIIMYLLN